MPTDDLTRAWGIAPSYALCQVPIRILFVIDGQITLDKNLLGFGLGYVLETLTAPFSFFVRFEIDVAKRDGSLEAEQVGSHQGQRYRDFRFTNPGFDIDSYDQIWFFGNHPQGINDIADDSASDLLIENLEAHPLTPDELRIVAEWMDRGGGVFAAGDHALLGASMCWRLPRVRTMRRWARVQSVPSKEGLRRNQTLQATGASSFTQEGDTTLQPIEVVYRRTAGPLPFLRPLVPHPLLCSCYGVIDHFPDHMHEGEIIPDDRVDLDLPLGIAGYDRPEYPFVTPEVIGRVFGGSETLRYRPQPHVIAYGRTTNTHIAPPTDVALKLAANFTPFDSRRFGLVGVYDGDAVGLGRVVVDSTWHHWFSMNLDGIAAASDQLLYKKMQTYYRNVGQWLARPSQRQSMLVSGTWGVLIGAPPMTFDRDSSPWYIGEQVLATLERTTPHCMLGDFVAPFLDIAVIAASSPSGERVPAEPSWGALPAELVQRALVGGIGRALLGPALDHRELRARGHRPRLDVETIRRRAAEGAVSGRALLDQSVNEGIAALSAIRTRLATAPTPEIVVRVEESGARRQEA